MLLVWRKVLDDRMNKQISIDGLTKMAEFTLKNNYFEFNRKFKKQISGNTIATKFAPPYACIFMDQVKTEFLETQKHKRLEKALKKKVIRVPIKKKVLTTNHSSYISKMLRKIIMRRSFLEKKYFTKRTDQSLRAYKKQKKLLQYTI